MEQNQWDEDGRKAKENPTKDNLARFAVSYIERNRFTVGYYDYFSMKTIDGESYPVKIHYKGRYGDFVFCKEKSDSDCLVFSCSATCLLFLPSSGMDIEMMKTHLQKEIRERSGSDILRVIDEELEDRLEDDSDWEPLDFEFPKIVLDVKEWSTEVIEDDDI